MTNRFTISNQESGGRVLVLFLLFFLALYQFYSAGFNSFAIICLLPLLVPVIYVTFTWQMLVFWALFVINYFVQWFGKNQWLPGGIPTSMYNELLEILLIVYFMTFKIINRFIMSCAKFRQLLGMRF